MNVEKRIETFLAGSPFAVVGASTNREKYGNKVFRAYLQKKLDAYPVNPSGGLVEGIDAYTNLEALPETPHGVSIITPPKITEEVVDSALKLGIENIWMQPGAENPAAVEKAEKAGANVISGGPCVLVILDFHDE
jgi:predicted CoA-binding protein